MKNKSFVPRFNFARSAKIDFLKRLTTPTGILQHTKFGVPHRSLGYSLDDNARALIVVIELFKLYKQKECLDLALTYLSFLVHAKRDDGFFHNFQTYDHKFLAKKSQDAFGECVWALGVTIANDVRGDLTLAAKNLFAEIEKNIENLNSPRAKAYATLGLCQILKKEPENKNAYSQLKKLVSDLLALYEKYQEGDWNWFERSLNYANHILPAALFAAYWVLGGKKILEVATKTLTFLEKETHTKEGAPSPIGSNGWFPRGGEKAIFDQQPVEAAYAVIANAAAFKATKNKEYRRAALEWFAWFHGNNIQKVAVYDKKTGGCFDGIGKFGLNLNQGAESVICYLLAYLELAKLASKKKS
jgi:uncharacterized protein YyaL (SSP411 family)